MPQMDFLHDHQIVPIHGYSADLTAATQDVISLKSYRRLTIVIMAGATNGDTSTLTVNASLTNTASGGTAIAFKYRTLAAAANPATSDAWSALTDAAAAGIALTATTYKCWLIEVTAEDVAAGLADADWVYLAFADGGSALTGSMFAILSEPRYLGASPETAIA